MTLTYQDALAYGGIAEAHPGGHVLTKKILKSEKIIPGAKVLDAGCGTGLTSLYVAKELKCTVYAVDKHPQMIQQATKRCKKEKLPINIVEASLENLPFEDETFDWIIAESSTVFTSVSKSLAEYFRVLTPNGSLLCIEMTKEDSLTKNEEDRIKKFYNIEKMFSEKDWIRAIQQAGFHKVDVLKSKTILQELQEYDMNEDKGTTSSQVKKMDRKVQNVLLNHSQLLLDYAEDLGYRVMKATKKE